MDFLPDLSTILNGGISAFNLFFLLRLRNLEQELERERKFFLDFRKKETQTNQDLDQRLKNIEFECYKRWSTWQK